MNQRQERALHFIKGYIESNQLAPTVTEIGRFIGLRSTASVYYILRDLERMNLITRTPNISRGIQLAQPSRVKSKPCQDQQCRRAGQLLPFNQFPRNRNMSDGRFSYCRECAGRRTKEYRKRLKEMKAAQPKPPTVERKAMVRAKAQDMAFSKVYDAIAAGARTRTQIKAETELDYDLIGEALCELVFEARGVVIRNREFVLVENAA